MNASEKKETHNRNIVKGMSWEVLAKTTIQIASWVSTIIIARILDPTDYGLVATSGIFIGLFLLITEFGLAQGLINKSKISDEEITIVFWISMIISLLLFTLIIGLAPLISKFYGEPILTDIIRISALMLIFSSLKVVPIALLMRAMNFRYSALVQMASQAMVIIVAIISVYSGMGVWSLIYSVLAGQIVQMLFYIPYLKRVGFVNLNYRRVKGILSFGGKMMTSNLLYYSTKSSTPAIVGAELGQKNLGYYDMSQTLSNMPLDKIGSIFNKVAFPAISKVKKEKEHVRDIFFTMHKYLFLVGVPIFSVLILSAETIVTILFTEKWLPVVPLLQVLAVVSIFRLSGMLMPNLFAGLGMPNEVMKYNLLSAICVPIFVLIGVQWGLIGAVVSLLILQPMLYLYLIYRTAKILDVTVVRILLSIWQIFLSVTIMSFVLVLYVDSDFFTADVFGMVTMVLISLATYSVSLILLDRSLLKEIKEGVSLLRS